MQERFERRNTSALEDMAAPLQITVGPATRGKTNFFVKCILLWSLYDVQSVGEVR
jgi:hypothetical protein